MFFQGAEWHRVKMNLLAKTKGTSAFLAVAPFFPK